MGPQVILFRRRQNMPGPNRGLRGQKKPRCRFAGKVARTQSSLRCVMHYFYRLSLSLSLSALYLRSLSLGRIRGKKKEKKPFFLQVIICHSLLRCLLLTIYIRMYNLINYTIAVQCRDVYCCIFPPPAGGGIKCRKKWMGKKMQGWGKKIQRGGKKKKKKKKKK